MKTLDQNELENVPGPAGKAISCRPLYSVQCISPKCKDFDVRLTQSLMACGGEFYGKCPAFDRLERVCWFEPAIEAAKWKEKIQLDRIAQLEARVKELELRK